MCRLCRSGDGSFDLGRRQFLACLGGTATSAGLGLGGAAAAAPAPAAPEPYRPGERDKALVRAIYLRPRGKYWLGWPGTAFDVEGHCRDYEAKLARFAREIGIEVRVRKEPIYDGAGLEAFRKEVAAEKPDAVLGIPLHMNQWGQVDRLTGWGGPTLVFAGLGVCFTGHIQRISRKQGVYLMSTNEFDLAPVAQALRMPYAAHRLRRTRVVVYRGGQRREQTLQPLGIRLRYVPRDRFAEIFASIPVDDEVRAIADDYSRRAEKIVEPRRQDILNAARNYLACRKAMAEEGCNAITMDCLGLVGQRKIPCPPCLGFSKLLDQGIGATCEADVNAICSQNVCNALLGRPGFMQDPVPETVHNTFIGAHCTSPTRLRGFKEAPEPFRLRSHSESDIGVSLQILWKPGERVTIMQYILPDRMILGAGRVLKNCDTPPAGGCRTSAELALDAPPDTRDSKGFHQLFIYGDHVRTFQGFCQLYGLRAESI